MSVHDALLEILEASIDKSVNHICVAYSGGIDSTVLLHLCHRLVIEKRLGSLTKLSAIHVNHGLSQHADTWQQHCEQTCVSLGVSFYKVSVDIELKARESLEAKAREMRYHAINGWAESHFKQTNQSGLIVLGQHQDDQTETLLLQLKRGSGVKGLASMPRQFYSDSGHHFARPLLNVSQADIIEYARINELNFVLDESNSDTRFDRNFLRGEILPLIKRRWPGFSKSVARTAKLCAQQSHLVELFARQTLDSIRKESLNTTIAHYEAEYIDIEQVFSLDEALQSEVLRLWLSENHIFPSYSQLNELLHACRASEDACPDVNISGKSIRRFASYLIIVSNRNVRAEAFSIGEFPFEYEHKTFNFRVVCEDGQGLDASHYLVTFAKLNSKLKAQANRPAKSIKQWCKEYKVPPWHRAHLPIICDGDEVKALVLADRVLNAVDSRLVVTKVSMPVIPTTWITL